MSGVGYRPSDALMRVVFDRVGAGVRGWQMVTFVHEWAMCEAEDGEPVGIERFGAWSPGSTRNAYRRLAEFRAAFGDELGPGCTPSDLIVWPKGYPSRDAVDAIQWRLAAA